MKKMLESCISR